MLLDFPTNGLLSSRSSGERPAITKEAIDGLKKEKIEFQNEKIKLRSRIVRMRNAYSKREQQISAVLNESRENMRLQTASSSTLQNLKRTIETLTNTLASRKETLHQFKKNDTYWRCREIEIEVRSLYQEQTRLEVEFKLMRDFINNYRSRNRQLTDFINSDRDYESAIRECDESVQHYKEKLLSYH